MGCGFSTSSSNLGFTYSAKNNITILIYFRYIFIRTFVSNRQTIRVVQSWESVVSLQCSGICSSRPREIRSFFFGPLCIIGNIICWFVVSTYFCNFCAARSCCKPTIKYIVRARRSRRCNRSTIICIGRRFWIYTTTVRVPSDFDFFSSPLGVKGNICVQINSIRTIRNIICACIILTPVFKFVTRASKATICHNNTLVSSINSYSLNIHCTCSVSGVPVVCQNIVRNEVHIPVLGLGVVVHSKLTISFVNRPSTTRFVVTLIPIIDCI